MDNSTVPPAPFRIRLDGEPDRRFGPHPGQRRRVTRKRLAQLKRARAARKPIGTRWILNPRPETVRMRVYRAKKHNERLQAQEAARVAHKAALAAARAVAGLPPAKTQAEVQAAYRRRRKLKGLDPYSKRELVEQAIQKAAKADRYESRVHGDVINQWFAPRMDAATAVAFVQREIVPAVPAAAEKYIQGIREECRRFNFHVNRYTLRPNGIGYAQILRALVWQQNGGKYLAASWDVAQHLGTHHLPADLATRESVMAISQSAIGNGDAIVTEILSDLEIKERSNA